MGTGGNQPPLTAPTSSPVQLLDWQSRLAGGNTSAQTRSVQGNELVANQLNKLTSSDSRYLQIARDNAMNQAGQRGMMLSTMAGGSAERAAIESGLPIAQADASTYGRTASENMAATNQDRLADQSMFGNLLGQEVGIRANLDEAERNRGWQSNESLLGRNWQTDERLGQQGFQTGERVATQGWQTGERLGQQGFQTGERIGQQNFQTGERVATQGFQTGERVGQQNFQTGEREATQGYNAGQNDLQRGHEFRMQETKNIFESAMRELDRDSSMTQLDKQLTQQRFLDFNNSMRGFNENLTQTLTAIYNNPNLSSSEQAAAARNAQSVHASLFNSYAATMSSGVPKIFWSPFEMQQPVSTGGNQPPSVVGGGFGGGGTVVPPPTTPTGTTTPSTTTRLTTGEVLSIEDAIARYGGEWTTTRDGTLIRVRA